MRHKAGRPGSPGSPGERGREAELTPQRDSDAEGVQINWNLVVHLGIYTALSDSFCL